MYPFPTDTVPNRENGFKPAKKPSPDWHHQTHGAKLQRLMSAAAVEVRARHGPVNVVCDILKRICSQTCQNLGM